ncbi:MAG: hypothetical protein F6J92_10975 [Symploca sp. SIO1A3]|nr:hypothetical protein [Symploca sp. SIO1A3]
MKAGGRTQEAGGRRQEAGGRSQEGRKKGLITVYPNLIYSNSRTHEVHLPFPIPYSQNQ